jgi:phosphatidylglycerophosphate synthase
MAGAPSAARLDPKGRWGGQVLGRDAGAGDARPRRRVVALRALLWAVTLLRVALIPVFLEMAGRAQEVARTGADPGPARWAVIAVLALIGLSDVVDGWIARRVGLATQLGALVDAVADKMVQVTLAAFFAFSDGPAYAPLPIWFLVVLIGRDAVLGGGLVFARSRGVPIRVVHRAHGRATSVVVFAVLAWISFGLHRPALPFVVGGAGLFIVLSGASYLKEGIDQARDVLRRRRDPRSRSMPGV